jgi:hypothetical protein
MEKYQFRDIYYLLREHKVSFLLLIFSFLFYFIFIVLCYDYPEWFNGAKETVDFLGAISLSYIAAYIFYLTTEFRSELLKLKISRKFSNKYHNKLISLFKSLLLYSFDYKDNFLSTNDLKSIIGTTSHNEDAKNICFEDITNPTGTTNKPIVFYIRNDFIKNGLYEIKKDLYSDGHLINDEVLYSINSILNSAFIKMYEYKHIDNEPVSLYLGVYEDLFKMLYNQNKIMIKVYGSGSNYFKENNEGISK